MAPVRLKGMDRTRVPDPSIWRGVTRLTAAAPALVTNTLARQQRTRLHGGQAADNGSSSDLNSSKAVAAAAAVPAVPAIGAAAAHYAPSRSSSLDASSPSSRQQSREPAMAAASPSTRRAREELGSPLPEAGAPGAAFCTRPQSSRSRPRRRVSGNARRALCGPRNAAVAVLLVVLSLACSRAAGMVSAPVPLAPSLPSPLANKSGWAAGLPGPGKPGVTLANDNSTRSSNSRRQRQAIGEGGGADSRRRLDQQTTPEVTRQEPWPPPAESAAPQQTREQGLPPSPPPPRRVSPPATASSSSQAASSSTWLQPPLPQCSAKPLRKLPAAFGSQQALRSCPLVVGYLVGRPAGMVPSPQPSQAATYSSPLGTAGPPDGDGGDGGRGGGSPSAESASAASSTSTSGAVLDTEGNVTQSNGSGNAKGGRLDGAPLCSWAVLINNGKVDLYGWQLVWRFSNYTAYHVGEVEGAVLVTSGDGSPVRVVNTGEAPSVPPTGGMATFSMSLLPNTSIANWATVPLEWAAVYVNGQRCVHLPSASLGLPGCNLSYEQLAASPWEEEYSDPDTTPRPACASVFCCGDLDLDADERADDGSSAGGSGGGSVPSNTLARPPSPPDSISQFSLALSQLTALLVDMLPPAKVPEVYGAASPRPPSPQSPLTSNSSSSSSNNNNTGVVSKRANSTDGDSSSASGPILTAETLYRLQGLLEAASAGIDVSVELLSTMHQILDGSGASGASGGAYTGSGASTGAGAVQGPGGGGLSPSNVTALLEKLSRVIKARAQPPKPPPTSANPASDAFSSLPVGGGDGSLPGAMQQAAERLLPPPQQLPSGVGRSGGPTGDEHTTPNVFGDGSPDPIIRTLPPPPLLPDILEKQDVELPGTLVRLGPPPLSLAAGAADGNGDGGKSGGKRLAVVAASAASGAVALLLLAVAVSAVAIRRRRQQQGIAGTGAGAADGGGAGSLRKVWGAWRQEGRRSSRPEPGGNGPPAAAGDNIAGACAADITVAVTTAADAATAGIAVGYDQQEPGGKGSAAYLDTGGPSNLQGTVPAAGFTAVATRTLVLSAHGDGGDDGGDEEFGQTIIGVHDIGGSFSQAPLPYPRLLPSQLALTSASAGLTAPSSADVSTAAGVVQVLLASSASLPEKGTAAHTAGSVTGGGGGGGAHTTTLHPTPGSWPPRSQPPAPPLFWAAPGSGAAAGGGVTLIYGCSGRGGALLGGAGASLVPRRGGVGGVGGSGVRGVALGALLASHSLTPQGAAAAVQAGLEWSDFGAGTSQATLPSVINTLCLQSPPPGPHQPRPGSTLGRASSDTAAATAAAHAPAAAALAAMPDGTSRGRRASVVTPLTTLPESSDAATAALQNVTAGDIQKAAPGRTPLMHVDRGVAADAELYGAGGSTCSGRRTVASGAAGGSPAAGRPLQPTKSPSAQLLGRMALLAASAAGLVGGGDGQGAGHSPEGPRRPDARAQGVPPSVAGDAVDSADAAERGVARPSLDRSYTSRNIVSNAASHVPVSQGVAAAADADVAWRVPGTGQLPPQAWHQPERQQQSGRWQQPLPPQQQQQQAGHRTVTATVSVAAVGQKAGSRGKTGDAGGTRCGIAAALTATVCGDTASTITGGRTAEATGGSYVTSKGSDAGDAGVVGGGRDHGAAREGGADDNESALGSDQNAGTQRSPPGVVAAGAGAETAGARPRPGNNGFRHSLEGPLRDKQTSWVAIDFAREVVLERRLGSGAYGTVYCGRWAGLPVACKVVPLIDGDGGSVCPQAVESIRQEVQVLSRLSHPHIVQFYGACLAPPNVCIVEELAAGGSLHNRLHAKRRGTGVKLYPPMTYIEVLRLGLEVASAMAYLHPHVVHRDLKPQNVLLDSWGQAKVCDFGIAKIKDRTLLSTRNAQAGTPAYMAPEQFEGRPVSEKVDVYAFGMTLYECFTGEQPWSELHNPMQVIFVVGVQCQRPPLPTSTPPALAQLITACWADDPLERPAFSQILPLLQSELSTAAQ